MDGSDYRNHRLKDASTSELLYELINRNPGALQQSPVRAYRYGRCYEMTLDIGDNNACFINIWDDDLRALKKEVGVKY